MLAMINIRICKGFKLETKVHLMHAPFLNTAVLPKALLVI